MKVTADDVRAVRLQCVAFLDGQGFARRLYRCVEFPELTRAVEIPRGRSSTVPKTDTFRVGETAVPFDHQIIADAINALRGPEPKRVLINGKWIELK
jgi:hypothetical protein